MIKVPKANWDKIPNDYKGRWSRASEKPYIGKRTVLSGCVVEKPGALLIEGVHFEIVKGDVL